MSNPILKQTAALLAERESLRARLVLAGEVCTALERQRSRLELELANLRALVAAERAAVSGATLDAAIERSPKRDAAALLAAAWYRQADAEASVLSCYPAETCALAYTLAHAGIRLALDVVVRTNPENVFSVQDVMGAALHDLGLVLAGGDVTRDDDERDDDTTVNR